LSDELCFLPIAEASRQIAARAVSPVALAEAYQAAPCAMAMTQLPPRDRSWNDDQASVFRLEQ